MPRRIVRLLIGTMALAACTDGTPDAPPPSSGHNGAQVGRTAPGSRPADTGGGPAISSTTDAPPSGRATTTTAASPGPPRAPGAGANEVTVPADDAEGLTRQLVRLAEGAAGEPSWPVAARWTAAGVPREAIVGADVVADGTTTVVSGFDPVAEQQTGGTYVAFAVAARSGSCWYAYVAASGGPATGEAKPASGACRGADAAAAFGLS